jgi:Domain of unknown function (DUF4440)
MLSTYMRPLRTARGSTIRRLATTLGGWDHPLHLGPFLVGQVTHVSELQSADEVTPGDTVQAFRRAMMAIDGDALDALCAVQLSYGHSSGKIQTKEEFIAEAISGKSKWKTLEFANVRNTVAGPNVISRFTLNGDVESANIRELALPHASDADYRRRMTAMVPIQLTVRGWDINNRFGQTMKNALNGRVWWNCHQSLLHAGWGKPNAATRVRGSTSCHIRASYRPC